MKVKNKKDKIEKNKTELPPLEINVSDKMILSGIFGTLKNKK